MSRTLLLGLDGATFTLLDGFMQSGVMPFLRDFTAAGVRARLLSTVCPVTPPAWTSMVTGRGPGGHGVFDFIVVDDQINDRVNFRLVSGQDVLAEPVWSIAARQGIASASLNFPASNYSPPFGGFMVPGFVTSRVLKMSVQPRELWNEIKELPGFSLTDVSWDLDEGRIPLGDSLEVGAFQEWIEYLIRKETGWFAIAKHLIAARDCRLLCIVFEGVDRLQHQAWALLDPATRPKTPTADEQQVIAACLKYFRHVDGLLRQLVEAAGDDVRTLVTSDHGFGPTREVFYANSWLAQQGYLVWKEQAAVDREGHLTAHNMREHFETIDWQQTVAYARTTSANGIYIRVAREPGQVGVAPADYLRVRDEIRRGLLSYLDPATGTPVVIRVLDRDEAFPGPAKDRAPDLQLFLRDEGFLSIMRSDQIVRPRREIKGTHRPAGILMAGGADIRRGATMPDQRIIDIAPTLLHSLGLAVPDDLEGAVIADMFTSEFLTHSPIVRGQSTQERSADGPQEREDIEGENIILERLKALGYVE